MSYVKKFTKQIAVRYSGSVSYPASQNGGSTSYSGTAYETVEVSVEVLTDPLEKSVDHCNSQVNTLTKAIVATEAAQIASINANAKKVSGTIVEGFFKTIRSEISQQIAALSAQVDTTLVHLRQLGKRCVEKQQQMQRDYAGIAARYLKIFDDLNGELANRIYELNKTAFVFKDQCDYQQQRSCQNDMVSTVAIFGAESSDLQNRISVSVVKKKAVDALEKANTYLIAQKQLNDTIDLSMLCEEAARTYYAPICFIETQQQQQINKQLYQQELLPPIAAEKVIDAFIQQSWQSVSQERSRLINRYFSHQLQQQYPNTDKHSERVKKYLIKMLDFNQIQSV